MADTTSYQNRYRGYLEDDADTYLKPEGSDTAKLIGGGMAAVGLLFGGLAAFKSGKMSGLMHSTIMKAGRYRKGKIQAVNQGIRNFSQQEGLDGVENATLSLLKGKFGDASDEAKKMIDSMKTAKSEIEGSLKEHADRMAKIGQSELRDTNIYMESLYKWKMNAIDKLSKENLSEQRIKEASNIMDQAIADATKLDQKQQELMYKQTRFRYATVGDLIEKKEINEAEDWIQEGYRIVENDIRTKLQNNTASKEVREAASKATSKVEENHIISQLAQNEFRNRAADNHIMIDSMDSSGNIADLRDFADTFNGTIHSLTTEFTIPLVKINPLRMFYLDHFFLDKTKPMFDVSASSSKNPLITKHNGAQGAAHLFVNGSVYNMNADLGSGQFGMKKIDGDFFLADAKAGPIARLIRNMSGISISEFSTPQANAPFLTKLRYNVQSALDIGFQDEPTSQFDLFDPTSWVSSVINKGTNKLRMGDYIKQDDYLRDAFGKNTDFIYMRKYKSLKDSDSYKDYIGQFNAGRDNMDNVTMATLFPYGFFERLNATLNQIGLGLSNKALGSASEVFGGLLLKRIAPVWAGAELWDYLNYESEELVGFQFEDRFAQMYANSSVEMAKLRDNLGITDWAKGVAPLLVGGEHIAEIPFLGDMLDWNDTAEETQEYWDSGEDPVRKGRWWPLGNTPYTGSSIDYFQPNWVRRTLADVEFTDSQYGSREEYFQNSWMPSLRHPLAPIRHFFTDPYHWEEKHYQDRPYMLTGGIAELEAFPLIGPILNSTVGQVLKPQKMMHAEMWSGTETVGATEIASGMESLGVPIEITEEGNYQQAPQAVSMPIGTDGFISEGTFVSTESELRGDEVNQILATYVTSSGQASVLKTNDEEAFWDAQAIISEKSPTSTGVIQRERLPVPEIDISNTALPDSTASLTQMLGNLHYNASEMGGFYGFVGTSSTGEMFKNRPVLQSSDEMTSYSRAFWDMDIGGFGGDANEIFRRFVPKDRKLEEINAIPNTMPDWLPGQNYFIDFQTGDPYIKVKKGEMRLPGGGYEAIQGIDTEDLMKMDIGASFVGYDEETIRTHMLKGDAYKDEAFAQILKAGSKWHKSWESEMARKNIAISTEQYVKDESVGIGGFYDVLGDHEKLMNWMLENAVDFTFYQALDDPERAQNMLNDGLKPSEALGGFFTEGIKPMEWDQESKEQFFQYLVSQSPTALIDPKTRGTKSWENDEMHFENVQQVNFYATQVGTPINYLIHVDRQNPEKGIKVFAFEQSDALNEYAINKVEGVRQGIRDDIDNGRLHRGDLYEIVDRYRILADVAPYSQEFRNMKAQMSGMGLSEEEMEEVRTINEQVAAKKEKLRVYPYRFKTANVENDTVTVDHVIDTNTFIAKEFPDNPIRLAGVRVSVAQDNPVAEAAAAEVGRVIRPGATIKIAYDADEQNRIKDDTYKTLQAVVYDKRGRNLNQYLINQELGKERESDYSPAAVHARFTPNEIRFGAMWEEFAHMDTMIHTKLLQVRSPIEQYERREVYGKDWQEWTDPIGDYLIPAIQNSAMHNPILAVAGGAFIGAAFGSLKRTDIGMDNLEVTGRYGKIVGALIGASVMGAAVLNRMVHEAATGERWIPERRQKERDTEEYFDVLEYIKYNSLYNKYATEAMKKEGVDVKEFITENKEEGEFRKKKKSDLERIKRDLYNARPNQVKPLLEELKKLYGIDAKTKDEAMKLINKELNDILNSREMRTVTPLAAKALMFHQASKQTMYGYEAGDPISNILSALPKKDRDYLTPFINSPEEERERILQTVPNYMKRVLQSAWGMPVDEKVPLQEFFKSRPLPGANWKGWSEEVAIDDIKVKFVDNVGLDPSEFDIWPDDKARADAVNAPAPDVFNGQESAKSYERKLKEILTGINVKGLDINVVQSNSRGVNTELTINHDRKDDVQSIINREGYHVI